NNVILHTYNTLCGIISEEYTHQVVASRHKQITTTFFRDII
ncbi:unnamed protein product, partial [Heterotrigona itama]